MSDFQERWRDLARASRVLPEAPLPPVPLRHWPLRVAPRGAAISPGERRGLALGTLALTASWVLAVLLWPAVTAPAAHASPTVLAVAGPVRATTPADLALPPVAHLSAEVPALPHPSAPTALLAQAYIALTASSEPAQEPHL